MAAFELEVFILREYFNIPRTGITGIKTPNSNPNILKNIRCTAADISKKIILKYHIRHILSCTFLPWIPVILQKG